MWVRVLPTVNRCTRKLRVFAAELAFEPFILPIGLEVCFVHIYVEKNSKINEHYLNTEEVSADGSVFINSLGLWIRCVG